jgi:hypothetical protein
VPAAVAVRCESTRTVTTYGRAHDVRCGRRSCPSCGVVWLGDTRIRAVAAGAQLRTSVALVSVTAPGRHILPWDATGERVEQAAAQEWNRAAPAQWSKLHACAARDAREVAGNRGADWRLLFKAWEYQRRGVLHLHLVVPCGTPGERLASEAYVRGLVARASRYGFGFVDRGKLPERGARRSTRELSPVPPGRAAAYVTSYVASSGAGKGGVAEVAANQGVPGAILYVSNVLTRASGVTMRSLKERRRVACRYPDARSSGEAWQAACVVDAMDRRRPPFSAGTRGALLQRALSERWSCAVDARTGEVRSPTGAPAPPGLTGGNATVARGDCVAVLRLDSVLHRSDESGHPEWITTAVVVQS